MNFLGTSTTKYGINSLNFGDAMLRNMIPKNIKLLKMLLDFEKKLKKQMIPCNCVAYYVISK